MTKITINRSVVEQVLEALEGGADSWQLVGPAIDALKEALAEPFSPEAISTTQTAMFSKKGCKNDKR